MHDQPSDGSLLTGKPRLLTKLSQFYNTVKIKTSKIHRLNDKIDNLFICLERINDAHTHHAANQVCIMSKLYQIELQITEMRLLVLESISENRENRHLIDEDHNDFSDENAIMEKLRDIRSNLKKIEAATGLSSRAD